MRRIPASSLGLAILFCATVSASAQYFSCAGYDDDFDCEEAPRSRTTAPCPPTISRDWTVSNTVQANALAVALNCPGGVFNVEWRGMVTLDRELNVLDGAVLNITGVDSEAGVDGGGGTRAFTVINATLLMSNMAINNGSAAAGGAIVASGSSLTLDHTSFANNTATQGGALYAGRKSTVSLSGKTRFSDNTAGEGGALHVSERSSVSWTSEAHFENNRAENYGAGGALFVDDGSIVSWSAETYFSTNSAKRGGALFVGNGSNACWTAETRFFGNTAGEGGDMYVENLSSVYWTASTSFVGDREAWERRRAGQRGPGLDGTGGALQVSKGSTTRWSAETNFTSNFASWGGALSVEYESSASWNATTIFSNNKGKIGGALHVRTRSSVFWDAKTYFTNNQALLGGGAVSVQDESSVSWSSDALFSGNRANWFGTEGRGGALVVYSGSTASWTAETSFSNNSASEGGALYIGKKSSVVWGAKTLFSDNVASYRRGGALNVLLDSTVSWTAETYFSNNTARYGGGGLMVYVRSAVSWTAETVFSNNSARRGGAMEVGGGNVSWTARTSFAGNSAYHGSGGALYVDRQTRVFWDAETPFYDNSASGSGGAVFMGLNTTLRLGGPTEFGSNLARLDGGAIGSSLEDSEELSSLLQVNDRTDFSGNACGRNGGAVAVVGALSLTFETEDVVFEGNSAGISGGAVYISATTTGFGPRFVGARFTSNIAQFGGAVYVNGSGTTAVTNMSDVVSHPTMFIACNFVANEAVVTGATVESGAGLGGAFANARRIADGLGGSGGALRLTGTTSLNGLDCAAGTFLDGTAAAGDLFLAACDGCSTTPCDGCSVGGPASVPVCSSALEHSRSAGGNATVESLEIVPGYWRATATSRDVLACFNADACLGGLTGTGDYCRRGYEGPYCSVCSDGFTTTAFGFTCSECKNKGSGAAAGAAVAAVVVLLLLVVAFFWHLVARHHQEGSGRDIVARVTRRVPVHSLKTVIIVWQIVTQFASTANVNYSPDVYQYFLGFIDVLNFDLRWMPSIGCIVDDMDFHDHLLLITIGPLVVLAFLGGTNSWAVYRNRASAFALRHVQQKHMSATLLVLFLVYSPVSSALFQTFSCEKLDDGKDYLRADYRIECDLPRHRALEVYAGFMIAAYTLGVPLLYTALLYRNRSVLRDGAGGETAAQSVATTSSDLWIAYKPNRFYYEVVECGRRVSLAWVAVFMHPNTTAQIAVVALVIAVFFFVVSESLAPYVSRWDAWVSRMGHVIVCASVFVTLLLKVDFSGDEREKRSQKVFGAILVSANAVMVAVVVAQAFMSRKPRPEKLKP